MIYIKSFKKLLPLKFEQPDITPIGETRKGPIYTLDHDVWAHFVGAWKVGKKFTTSEFEIFIAQGAKSDGVSSPRILRSVSGITVDGVNRMAGQLHDASYRSKGWAKKVEYRTFIRCGLDDKVKLGRKACDQIYREFSRVGGSLRYKLAYFGLRTGGWAHFGKKAPGF